MKSGHIKEICVNNIIPNISSCFIMKGCAPQEKLLDEPYTGWVWDHKQNREILATECQCPAGVSEVCKHVGGLLCSVEVAVCQKEEKLHIY